MRIFSSNFRSEISFSKKKKKSSKFNLLRLRYGVSLVQFGRSETQMKINHLRFNRDHQSRIMIIRQSQFDRIGSGFGWMRPARAGQGQPRWLDLSAGSLRLSRINSVWIGIEFGIALLNAFELVTNSFCVQSQIRSDPSCIVNANRIWSSVVRSIFDSVYHGPTEYQFRMGNGSKNREKPWRIGKPLRCIHGFYQNRD